MDKIYKEIKTKGSYSMLDFASIRTVNYMKANDGFVNNTKGKGLELITTYCYKVLGVEVVDQSNFKLIDKNIKKLDKEILEKNSLIGINFKYNNLLNNGYYKITNGLNEYDDINDEKFLEDSSTCYKLELFFYDKVWCKCNKCGKFMKINNGRYYNLGKLDIINCKEGYFKKFIVNRKTKNFNKVNKSKIIEILDKNGLITKQTINKEVNNSMCRPDHYFYNTKQNSITLIEDKNKEHSGVIKNDIYQLRNYGIYIFNGFSKVNLKMIYSGRISKSANYLLNIINSFDNVKIDMVSYREMLRVVNKKNNKAVIGIIYTKTKINNYFYKNIKIEFLQKYAGGFYYILYIEGLNDNFANSDNVRFFLNKSSEDNFKSLDITFKDFNDKSHKKIK